MDAVRTIMETVSKLLAHQKIITTQEYAQVLDHKVSELMRKVTR
jgi:hypothetical protein